MSSPDSRVAKLMFTASPKASLKSRFNSVDLSPRSEEGSAGKNFYLQTLNQVSKAQRLAELEKDRLQKHKNAREKAVELATEKKAVQLLKE